MNTSALIIMISSFIIITGITVMFFVKVLTMPKHKEPDSYSEN